MHWKDTAIIGWISVSAVAFNAQLIGNAVFHLLNHWNAPRRCKDCQKKLVDGATFYKVQANDE